MYYLLLFLLYPVSLLPLRVLYGLSDFTFVVIYHLMGYRKEIVMDNLRHAFPQMDEAALQAVRRRFYRNFCDQWVETLKLLSMSERELKRRVSGNFEVFSELFALDRNIYLMSGHTFNWEWANLACQLHSPQQYACIYLPLTSTGFDRLMLRIRTRFGVWMISMKALKSGLSRLQNVRHILGLAADQNPAVTETAIWIPFMNREAPFFRGGEQMARRAKAAVVFIAIRKVRRGYYHCTLERAYDDASVTAPEEVTRAYVAFVERQLRQQPENWLWSHRRWKHVRRKR